MASDSPGSTDSTLIAEDIDLVKPRDPRLGDRVANRFTLVAMLGAGAHGVVYEAEDESSGRPVALKMLSRLDPDELYRFKREFRVLADVSDENLVHLHELFVDEAGAFFTMELIRGTDFLSYTRGNGAGQLDEARLRDALRQLCQGLEALHGFGRLHRDLKPSNVLVNEEGHVSVADFGLAEELRVAAIERALVGTPAYMSPEQAAGMELTPASDWYSVGVMLYEALTGRLPFAGSFGTQMLLAKQGPEPPPPSSMVDDLPGDLDALCCALLRREPDERPDGPQILGQLGRPATAAWSRPNISSVTGRDTELTSLHEGFVHTCTGEPGQAAALLLHGRSGMGKTTVLDAFVDELGEAALVLRGRCYERESLPYKGLDAMVDELRGHLNRDRAGLAPVAGATSLAQLFPVLGDVKGIGDVRHELPEDPVERRRQAVAALSEVLTQLIQRRPLVLMLDDLQWCDADTVAILVALLRPRSRPGLLLVGSYRDEDLGRASPLVGLKAELERLSGEFRYETIAVEALPPPAARELALQLLGERDDAEAMANAIASEAEGSPLFITELARSISAGRSLAEDRALTLDDVIRDRATELPTGARALLEMCVLVAGPIHQALLAEAAEVEDATEMLALLRSRSFVRTGGPRPEDPVEPFHDRIRTAMAGGLDAERRRKGHARLAEVLGRAHVDPETVADHLLGAGQPQRAGEYVARAAGAAADALAFERAARLYALALELVPGLWASQPRWRQARAEALAHAGRSAESAAAYREACRYAPPEQVVPLRRNAAEQFLRSGRIDEGTRELLEVFEALGVWHPPDPRLALAGFLWERARIRLRGTEFKERPESEVDPHRLLRIDTIWTAATGLQQSNVIVGQYFQAQHLLLALEAGEPHRVARALGVEAIYAATSGTEGAAQVDELVERVLGLARRLNDPRAQAMAHLAAGTADLYRGRFVSARPHLLQAEDLMRSQCTNVAWELSMTHTFLHMVHYHLGDFEALETAMNEALEDAAERDDLHTALMLRVAFGPMPALAAGDLSHARAVLAECEADWPSQLKTSTYSYVLVLTQSRIERYARRPAAAWQAFEEHWPTIIRSLLLTKQPFRTFLLHDRACTALWLAQQSGPLRRLALIRQANANAKTLLEQGTRWATAVGLSVAAMVSQARGERERALEQALRAERGLQELGMRIYAACMKKRRGEIMGGSAGTSLIEHAEGELRRAGLVALDPMTDMLMPPARGW
ncbi:MAG: protein kinase [Myxococcota bacterium]